VIKRSVQFSSVHFLCKQICATGLRHYIRDTSFSISACKPTFKVGAPRDINQSINQSLFAQICNKMTIVVQITP